MIDQLAENENIQAFLGVLDPADRTTGGGTAAAVAGAMAAALTAMVAELSKGRQGMEPADFYKELSVLARKLSADLRQGGAQDRQAFSAVRDALRLPRQTEDERALRQQAVQAAWIQATCVPLANAERCAQILELITRLEGRSNPNAESDLKCAAYLAHAGLSGCLENVEINVPSIQDRITAGELSRRAQALRQLMVIEPMTHAKMQGGV
jgi:formiminotetrahydrofolate cyclodeaminase